MRAAAKIIFGIFVVLGAIAAQASVSWQLPADSRVVFQSEAEVTNYLLMLGIYRRINNEWRTQGTEELSGVLRRQTLELPRGTNEQKLFATLKDQLAGRRELFSCAGLLCGPSNAWANTHFGKSMLYGLDAEQYYGVYEVAQPQGLAYVVIYVVRRGNGSVMAQLEELKVPESELGRLVSSPKSIANALHEQGYFSIPLSFSAAQELQVSAAQLQAVVDFLNSEPADRFTLVGHDYRLVKDNLAAGTEHATTVLAMLKSRKLRTSVGVFSVGKFAPAGRGRAPVRVDLVRS